ncbi:hypothetical protein FRC02_006706 [Tulasnella sp. 418]|nr:hypothetical protein FRC02_006706 [Tulasnella sp. 418]
MNSLQAGLHHLFEEERNRYAQDFSPNAAAILGYASLLAYIRRHNTVQYIHILSALLSRSKDGSPSWLYINLQNAPGRGPEFLLALCNKTLDELPQVSHPKWVPVDQSDAVKVIEIAKWVRDQKKEQLASQASISFAICHMMITKQLLEKSGIPVDEMTTRLLSQSSSGMGNLQSQIPKTTSSTVNAKSQQSMEEKAMSQRYGESDPSEALKKFTVDLTELAEQNKIDPIIGRDSEIRRAIQVLCRRTKNNPVLIGEPGVGKTSIAEGIALRIVKKEVPESLQGRLLSLDIGALNAGPLFAGEFESRLKQVMDAIEKANSEDGPGIVLFIDEMHLIMGGGEKQGGKM